MYGIADTDVVLGLGVTGTVVRVAPVSGIPTHDRNMDDRILRRMERALQLLPQTLGRCRPYSACAQRFGQPVEGDWPERTADWPSELPHVPGLRNTPGLIVGHAREKRNPFFSGP